MKKVRKVYKSEAKNTKDTNKTSVKKKRPKKKLLIGILSVFLVIVCMVGFVITNHETVLSWFGMSKELTTALGDKNQKYSMLSLKENLYENFDSDILISDVNTVNILVFGLDENEERHSEYVTFRPDTIMLLSVNFKSGEINLVSIPRDTLVYLPTRGGKDKINTCFYYGSLEEYDTSEEMFQNGVDTLKSAVSYLFGGININYYVGVNMDTAVDVIDAMGGVTFNLEYDVYYDSTTLFYEAGERVWNGDDFITLARLRGYAEGDIERTRMQQKLLKALFAEIKNIKFTELTSVIKLAYSSLNTDIDMKTAVSFVLAALDIDLSNMQTATFPGNFGNWYGVSYWIIDQNERVPFIQERYGFRPSYLEQDERYKVEETEEKATSPTDPSEEGTDSSGGETGESPSTEPTPTPTPTPTPEAPSSTPETPSGDETSGE